MKAIHDISLSFLASVYLMAAFAMTCNRIEPMYAGFGPTKVASQTCATDNTPRQKSYVQHHHIPLVKLITTPVETACVVEYSQYEEQRFFVLPVNKNVSHCSCFLCSIPDRAPPSA